MTATTPIKTLQVSTSLVLLISRIERDAEDHAGAAEFGCGLNRVVRERSRGQRFDGASKESIPRIPSFNFS